MKIGTAAKLPKFSWIMALNAVALGVLIIALGSRVSFDHRSEIDSAVRASRRLVKSVVSNRDLARNERAAPCHLISREVPADDAEPVVAVLGRFE